MRFLVVAGGVEMLAVVFPGQVGKVALLHFFVAIPPLLLGERYPPRAAEQIAHKSGDGWYASYYAEQGQKTQKCAAGDGGYVYVRHRDGQEVE